MRIGLSYDLKDEIKQEGRFSIEDALEEYDSPEVVKAISAALRSIGHIPVRLGGGRRFLSTVIKKQVDLVFNIAEGRGNHRSREGQVPSILEMLDIPYTGSDPLTLGLTLDKPLAKEIVRHAGVPTPDWILIKTGSEIEHLKSKDLPLPVFIKPAFEGSSKGIRLRSIASTLRETKKLASQLLTIYNQPVLIEHYIEGHEVTVGLVGNSPPKIVGIMRVVPRSRFKNFVYSLEVKRNWQKLVDYECPAKLPETTTKRIKKFSIAVYQTLNCRDFSRIDFRIDRDGQPYFLEVNPLPGLNPVSGDLPIMAGKMGWTYDELIKTIVESAVGRYKISC